MVRGSREELRAAAVSAGAAARSGRDEEQQDVLDHVDREQGRVVPIDPRKQGEATGGRPSRRGNSGPPARYRVDRMKGVHPAVPPSATSRTRGSDLRLSGVARRSSPGAAWRPRVAGTDNT